VQILNLGTGENIVAPTEISATPGVVERPTQAEAREEAPLNLESDIGKLSPRLRPEVLTGKTYKVKTGYGNLYVTVNDDERGAPFEVFASLGKTGGFYQEVSEGICRMISMALRSGIKVSEIISSLKGIRGPMPVFTNKGTILSLSDAIGQVLEEHAKSKEAALLDAPTGEMPNLIAIKVSETSSMAQDKKGSRSIADLGMMPGCPDCGSPLELAEGCISCRQCGFSRCS
jgi:ribonucleoside-diphosphate reductase alpha chain